MAKFVKIEKKKKTYYVLLINDMLFSNCEQIIYEISLEIASKVSFTACIFIINNIF